MNKHVLEADGPLIATLADVSTLIGATWGLEVDELVVPVSRLHASFFDLSTRFAGELLQKLVNHRLKLTVVGDVSPYVERSTAFRDFVREVNRGAHVRFVETTASL